MIGQGFVAQAKPSGSRMPPATADQPGTECLAQIHISASPGMEMTGLGFEPRTYGLKVRCSTS